MLDDPRILQVLNRKYGCLHRMGPRGFNVPAIEINGPLAFQGVVPEDASGYVLKVCAQHVIKQAGPAAGDIAVIGINQLGDAEAPPPVGTGHVGFTFLDPEIGRKNFQRGTVAPDRCGNAGELQYRDAAGIQAAGGEDDQISLAQRPDDRRGYRGVCVKFGMHRFDREAPPRG